MGCFSIHKPGKLHLPEEMGGAWIGIKRTGKCYLRAFASYNGMYTITYAEIHEGVLQNPNECPTSNSYTKCH